LLVPTSYRLMLNVAQVEFAFEIRYGL